MTDEEQEAADWQEARSIRYGLTLRVALLSSGRWMVFWRDGQGQEQLELGGSVLDEGGMRSLALSQRAELDQEPQTVTKSAEDMGL